MPALPWFRMYTEFASDPVVQTLAFEDQRHYIMLLCFKCSGLLDRKFPNPETRTSVIRKGLGLDGTAWQEMRERLMAIGLIDDNLQPCAWDERQFSAGTTAAERQKRYRQRNALRNANVTVTLQDKDKDKEDISTEVLDSRAAPKKPARKTQLKIDILPEDWQTYCKTKRPELNPETVFTDFREFYLSHGRTMLDWKLTWQRWVRNENQNGKSYRTGQTVIPENRIERSNRKIREALAECEAQESHAGPVGEAFSDLRRAVDIGLR